jgi:hypothetical protein
MRMLGNDDCREHPSDSSCTEAVRLQPISFDFAPVWASLDATFQGGTRLDADVGGSMFAMNLAAIGQARFDFFALDYHSVEIPDGTARGYLLFWPLRFRGTSPVSGTDWELSWGVIGGDFPWPGEARDHRATEHDVFALALGDLTRTTVQYRRQPYLTMSGHGAYEDRMWVETVRNYGVLAIGRAYVARTVREGDDLVTHTDWTGGVEVTGAHRVGPLDMALGGELGRTFYGTYDEGAPQAGFGARATLSASYARQRRFERR